MPPAEFIDDASVTRNVDFSRDSRHSQALQSKREEWAQGVICKAQSGYVTALAKTNHAPTQGEPAGALASLCTAHIPTKAKDRKNTAN
ncbi:OprD family outer membrane porin [Pseudomonas sp. LRF_L74]|uniref:OprD family outer membrane porin n=1 Tax=Pseudomonas sp. LRF_L74 TaxID=3369422 RepID=UPI003F5F9A59